MIATATPRDSTAAPSDDRGGCILLYDPDCGFCRTALALVLRADTRRRLRPLALSSAEADRLLPDLTVEQREASWHLVDPAGHRTSAGAAGAPLLRLLPGGSVPAALLAAVPDTTERAYRFVAGRRSTLSRLIPAEAKRRATALIARRSQPA
jgi:predicted DCC family thiol-disulfide oxidoreductase YuxK